jgi:hypothetical protein
LPARKSKQTAQRLQNKIDSMMQQERANNSSLDAFKKCGDTNFDHLSQIMKDLWSEFGLDSALNSAQLEIVFKKFGLQNEAANVAVKEVYKRLDLTMTDCIGFTDFISMIKSEEWSAGASGGGGAGVLSPIDSRNGSEIDIGARRMDMQEKNAGKYEKKKNRLYHHSYVLIFYSQPYPRTQDLLIPIF